MRHEVLRMDNVTFIEKGVTQLDRFNLQIFEGEIMGLISVNGHGLETLMNLLQQNLPLHYGNIYYRDQLVNAYKYSKVTENKIALIEKQSRLVNGMTVSDNVFVLRKGFKKHVINPKVLKAQIAVLMDELGIFIDSDERVENLSFFKRFVVEVCKAVVAGAKLIAIRDISNLVTEVDLHRIQRILDHYTNSGVSFLYICNQSQEVFKICHRCAIMRDGAIIKILQKSEMNPEVLKAVFHQSKMNVSAKQQEGSTEREQRTVLSLQNVSGRGLHQLGFDIYSGECVIIHDKDKSLIEALPDLFAYGTKGGFSGEVIISGEEVQTPLVAKRQFAFISEKPTQTILFSDLSYIDNLCFMVDHRMETVWNKSNIRKSLEMEYGHKLGDVFDCELNELSATQLYSLIFQRILLQRPEVAFFVQPFSGADIHLRAHIFSLLQELQEQNIAVVILDINIEDSLLIAQRVLEAQDGKITTINESSRQLHA